VKLFKKENEMNFKIYGQGEQSDLPAFELNENLNKAGRYIPAPALSDAVNVALALGQPLLLTGEPGTGKTQLAHHLAHFFKLANPLVFNAQTTSTATDLFYKYDALGHFQYAQNAHNPPLSTEAFEERFIRYEALGEAIRRGKRCVVLIDEIDKAPRDLPNDILAAIEQLCFRVAEIGRTFETDTANRPIIILTSNSEKNLPDAFLRRVVYYHIKFPNATQLLSILSQKTDNIPTADLASLIQHFEKIRQLKLKKLPATAELIYWALLLQKMQFPMSKLNTSALSLGEKELLHSSYSVLAKTNEDLESLKKL
jgi:MoxR-like ATPase